MNEDEIFHEKDFAKYYIFFIYHLDMFVLLLTSSIPNICKRKIKSVWLPLASDTLLRDTRFLNEHFFC